MPSTTVHTKVTDPHWFHIGNISNEGRSCFAGPAVLNLWGRWIQIGSLAKLGLYQSIQEINTASFPAGHHSEKEEELDRCPWYNWKKVSITPSCRSPGTHRQALSTCNYSSINLFAKYLPRDEGETHVLQLWKNRTYRSNRNIFTSLSLARRNDIDVFCAGFGVEASKCAVAIHLFLRSCYAHVGSFPFIFPQYTLRPLPSWTPRLVHLMSACWSANNLLTSAVRHPCFVAPRQPKQSFVSSWTKAVELKHYATIPNKKVTRLLILAFQVSRLMPNDSLKSLVSRPKKKWESHTQEAEKEARRKHVRQVEARGQRRYVHQNAKIIMNDDEKFRQLKEAIKKTGMLTSGGVKQVLLSPTLDDRRARLPTAKAV